MEDNAFLCFYELTTPLLACLYGMDANASWNAKDKRDFGDWMAPSSWLKALEVAGLVMVRVDHYCIFVYYSSSSRSPATAAAKVPDSLLSTGTTI